MAAASTAVAVGAALAVVVLQRYYMICTMPVYIHQHPNTFNNYHIISYNAETIESKFTTTYRESNTPSHSWSPQYRQSGSPSCCATKQSIKHGTSLVLVRFELVTKRMKIEKKNKRNR